MPFSEVELFEAVRLVQLEQADQVALTIRQSIAQQDDSGYTNELLAGLWVQYRADAEAMQLEKPDETPVRGGHGGKGVTTRNESPSTRTRWCFFGWREGERDERNRVVDVHALRVTFGTHLCAAGVPLRTAQAAMRHSKPELTANIYTDPKLLDVAGAIDALPTLALPADPAQTHTTASGTGRWRVMS